MHFALRDPAFGWHFAKFWAESGLSLDASAVPPAIVEAHHYLLEPGRVDPNMALAHALNLPESKPSRELLCALLLCKDTTPESIAQMCELDLKVVMLFEELFWNCLDRVKDRVYIGRICQQIEPQESCQSCPDIGLDLLSIAWQGGTSERVLARAGVPGRKEPLPMPRLLQQLRTAIMNSATQAGAQSKLKLDNPLLKVALTLATKLKERTAPPKHERISPAQSMRHVIDQVAKAGGVASGPVVDSYEI